MTEYETSRVSGCLDACRVEPKVQSEAVQRERCQGELRLDGCLAGLRTLGTVASVVRVMLEVVMALGDVEDSGILASGSRRHCSLGRLAKLTAAASQSTSYIYSSRFVIKTEVQCISRQPKKLTIKIKQNIARLSNSSIL